MKKYEQGNVLKIENIIESLKKEQKYRVINLSKNLSFDVYSNLNSREKELILQGGLLPYVRKKVLD